jgi:hypothetical protein
VLLKIVFESLKLKSFSSFYYITLRQISIGHGCLIDHISYELKLDLFEDWIGNFKVEILHLN